MPVAGYKAALLVSGTSTAITDEPTTQINTSRTYYIANGTRRILDPEVAVVVKDGGVVVTPDNYTVEHLAGRVEFGAGYTVGGAITITASYLPTLTIATARAATFNIATAMLDTTTFGDEAMQRERGLLDCSGTVERLDWGTEDYDPGAGTVRVSDLLAGGDHTLIQFYPDVDEDSYFAAWARLDSDSLSAEVADLAKGSLSWQGAVPGDALPSWWFGDPTT